MVERDIEMVVKLLTIEPLTRRELLDAMQDERQIGDSAMRVAIEGARAAGHLIVWRGGKYAIAETREQYDEWEQRELNPRLTRLAEERTAMRRTRDGLEPQLRLGVS